MPAPIRVAHFMRRPHATSFSIERLYDDIRAAAPADCVISTWSCRHFSTGTLGRLRDIWAARSAQQQVNHVTGDVHYLTYLLDHRRTVLTIHDLVMLERLRGIRRWLLWLLWYWIPVQRSRFVVVISSTTRSQLLSVVRCNPSKVYLIHNNVSPEFRQTIKPFHADKPRILQMGTGPNKNLERVTVALSGLSCRLVIVGDLSVQQRELLQHHQIEYENHSRITRAEVLDQYVQADMLVFASTYEGFGLPIVEANAVGRPVVTSNVSSMPEIAGDAACLVDPHDAASIRSGVLRVIEDPMYRSALIEAGLRNAARFQVAAVAEQYAAVYREIAATSNR